MNNNESKSIKEQRVLEISNFKNLGVSNLEEGTERHSSLKLNRSLEFEELGGLVLVMGLNNSGKSNVLQAIDKWTSGNFDVNDKPDFLTTEDIQPKLRMNLGKGAYSDDGVGEELWSVVSNCLRNQAIFDVYQNLEEKPMVVNNPNELANLSNVFIDVINGNRSTYQGFDDVCKTMAALLDQTKALLDYGDLGSNFIDMLRSKNMSLDAVRRFWHTKKGSSDYKFYSRYHYVLGNKVFRYDRNVKQINEADLKCQPGQINEFFKTLMTVIGIKPKDLSDVYNRATEKNGVRKTFEKKCNDKLKVLAKDFNNMFTANPNNEYRFELTLDTSIIYFTIYRGEIPLGSLDRQSDGFRWMFNFYFNFIKKISFNAGDIILMDEFGYNLNPKSIKELAVIIRNYAKTFGLTFVIATQNFLIVDTHHLDEIRLVINDSDGNSRIINEFEQFDHEDHDILRPLLDALTVSRNYMREEGHRTIFVEGSSDYFFLTAFADEMRKKDKTIDIDFLPINGLGKRDSDMRKTMSSLIAIESHPIVLADSDGAGKKFKEIADEMNKKCKKNVITVMTLSECSEDGKTTEIEQMFTESERTQLGLDKKSFDANACFAQNPKFMEKISEGTKKKFETLIDNISLG